MSSVVYSWGSAVHGGLGYVVSHCVNHVSIPRRVPLCDVDFHTAQLFCGRNFSAALTSAGTLYVWGSEFGLLPNRTDIDGIVVSNFSACFNTGFFVLIEKTTHCVYSWRIGQGPCALLFGGRLLCGEEVGVVGPDHFLVLEKESGGRLIEFRQGRPTVLVKEDCSRIWADSKTGFRVAKISNSIKIWSNPDSTEYPKAIIVRASRPPLMTSLWERDNRRDVGLSRIDSISFGPNGEGFIVSGEDLIRFTTQSKRDEGVIRARTVSLNLFKEQVRITSVSASKDRLLVLTLSGDVYAIPYEQLEQEFVDLDILDGPVLSQVMELSSSINHAVAIAKIVPFLPSRIHDDLNAVSLMRDCSLTIMKKLVTVENVVDLVVLLLQRPVVDLSNLLDFAYSFFRTNRLLIQCIAPAAIEILESSVQFKEVEKMMTTSTGFANCLRMVRQQYGDDWVERDPQPIVSPKPVGRPRVVQTSASYEPVVPTPTMTPVISLQVHSEDPFLPSPLDLDDFLPLSESTHVQANDFPTPTLLQKKVKKWNRRKLDFSPPQAPWVNVDAQQSSPPLLDVMTAEVTGARSKIVIDSRWFIPDSTRATKLAELMIQEREEQEVQEAIRLVEEYERSQRMTNGHSREAQKYSRSKRRDNRSAQREA